jgi:conjugative relaxase-like TrwC/TraI family protein
VLTYRTGAAGAPGVAEAMCQHLVTETEGPELQVKLAQYYGNGLRSEPGSTAALPRRDMNPAVAELLGIDQNKPLSLDQVKHILTGLRADGEPIEGQQQQGATKNKARIAYTDFCLSAPKSFSVSLAFAPTDAERAILDRSHRDAVDSTIELIASQVGLARRGKAGKKGHETGHIAWVQFDHYTARPTVKIPTGENGIDGTIIQTVKVAGDPQRHTHVIVPNVVLTDSGHVGGLHLQRIKDRIHEWGAVYQAYLATNLRRSGVEVELDKKTGMARLPAVPKWVDELYSKRTSDGEDAARIYAARQGLDWDRLSAKSKATFLKGGTKKARRYKGDDLADHQEWKRQADQVGYKHRSVLRPGEEQQPAEAEVRLQQAYAASLPVLEPDLERRSKFEGSTARVAAAKGLIASGIVSPEDIDAITKAYRTEGVRQDGSMTALMWGRTGGAHFQLFTTELHVEQEKEAIELLRAAAADKSSALTGEQIDAAVRKVTAERGLDFTSDHGQQQLEMVYRLGTAGRAVVGTGVAGSGKTALLEPLVEAWHSAGRQTYGVTLAWRQTHALAGAGVGRGRKRRQMEPYAKRLTDAGVEQSRTYALAAFLNAVRKGGLKPDSNSVVVIDEIAQVGTRQVLELSRLQAKHGFQIVGLGDDRQCQAIEAGSTIRLFQKALGTEQVPELLNTIRQQTERDRETTMLFRDGKAAEALARKNEDGTLFIVGGGYRQAVEAAVDLWQQRLATNSNKPGYTLALSAPTNHDAREIGAEVRRRRQQRGEIGPDLAVVKATDQTGARYDLPIAEGDRLRLFNKVNNGTAGRFGENGTVVEVVDVQKGGLMLRNLKGSVIGVPWDMLREKDTGRIRLTYGDALTIDARQGDTVTEHITVMPAGSHAVNGFKAYTAESRQRVQSWIVTSQGEEIAEIEGRRPLGDPRNLETDASTVRATIIANMARNLSRHPEKVLASDFLSTVDRVRKGTIRAMQAAWHRSEVREQGRPAATISTQIAERQDQGAITQAAKAVVAQQRAVRAVAEAIRPEVKRVPATAVKHARPDRRKLMSETELSADFADTLASAGFRLKGPPIMDGQSHRAPVDGDTRSQKSGIYRARLDFPPNGYYQNFRGGRKEAWNPHANMGGVTPEQRDQWRKQVEVNRQARDRKRQQKEEKTANIAQRMWAAAVPAIKHAYLSGKGVLPHRLRQDRKGRLLVPMEDKDGKVWNLQTISDDGTKLYMAGKKHGLYSVIGRMEPGKPVAIAEGFATAATVYEMSGIPTVIAFDSGNLLPVARAIRSEDPDRQIIFAADNDHHLPQRDPPLPNVGIERAHEAANEIGGLVLAPYFEPDERGSDWNDKAAQDGRRVTRDHLRERLAELGVEVSRQQRRGLTL